MYAASLGDGHVTFTSVPGGMNVRVDACIANLRDGKHGFHIHEVGHVDCDQTGGHYHSGEHRHTAHGGRHDPVRHSGDFGNVTSVNGCVHETFFAVGLTDDIRGRSIVIHADEDDLGRGDSPASRVNGSAGARVACGIIASTSP
jgi:Cu-Zn family superoxide dismutase